MTAISAADVRGYLELNGIASASKYSDGAISSNIRAAESFLEQATGRVFLDVSATKKFTTNGRTSITLPGLRAVSGVDPVTLQSTVLTADSTYFLIPDMMNSGVFTGIQFRGFSSRNFAYGYLSNPEWFDRNLDRLWERGIGYSLPNDLSITGSWGYTDATLPEAFRHADKVLAAWYTKRPDSVLADVAITPEGTALNYGDLPPEVSEFIARWRLTQDAAVSVG
jgi:hypothetical protein